MLADAPGAVARELLAQDGARVLAALAAPGDQNEGIHAARKAIRRMRAVLALLDEDEFELEREDRSLRRLGKSLSALRDAHVVVEAAKRLQALHPGPAWAAVVGTLEERRAGILQRAASIDPQFARRRMTIERVLQRLEAQPWERLRRRHVRAALARSERRVKRAASRAASDGDAEAIHRWRRRVRRLRMQLDAGQALGALGGSAPDLQLPPICVTHHASLDRPPAERVQRHSLTAGSCRFHHNVTHANPMTGHVILLA
ncbi:CHAD domain-containing protein [Stenotrophomonas rhizophila]|uniref:CHAD domain-containing protein n=1 Tax=Stenotrophomonas rhizophila TaxID=216778 RepID=UPI00201CB05E|nr:CHAD domain-containing protein [Stenotrophomonas rhizophila]UQY89501.1 CHAD domain-containing protein [Stenotrophomonas rhizophila]